MSSPTVQWIPDPARVASSSLARFIAARRRGGVPIRGPGDSKAFSSLHEWSVANPAEFWEAVWRDSSVIATERPDGSMWDHVLVGGDRMAPPDATLGPQWFTGAQLNFAENLLHRDGLDPAIIAWDEGGRRYTLTWSELRNEVARVAVGLQALGVVAGDRVAGWMPNIPATIIAMLGAVKIGATWTSCSPDFGDDGIVDRFGQTEPVVLFFADGYQYAGKRIDCAKRLPGLLDRLPSVRHAVMIHHLGDAVPPEDPRVSRWEQFATAAEVTPEGAATFERLPFDHPLYVLYSSGTTGLPKCIVHSAGGTLLQHMKEHRLHGDVRMGERLFYFTTCGWMMWNWQVSALAAGATPVLYDGAPMPAAEPGILWRLAAEERVQLFGTSAKYLALAEKAGLHPSRDNDLSQLRIIFSTGSPLAPEGFDWAHKAIGAKVQVASISGGTDIVSCFVLGNPLSPVRRGEIQGPGLGMAVDVFDEQGRPCDAGEAGELVCTRPFPAMPVAFWNDPDHAKYRAAYFERFPGVWCHGDWIARTEHGGFVISGRSDATLNPGGVRIGTAEIYRQVETIEEILESLVIGQRVRRGVDLDERIVLFVRLRDGIEFTPQLAENIKRRVRSGTSPHHVPKVILEVTDIPRTRSGKLSELAVRDAVEGREVKNVGALANPEALDQFRDRAELRT